MFERDYLVRMLVNLANAIRKSLNKARGEGDLSASIEILQDSITNSIDIDGSVLMSLNPDSFVSVIKVSNTDPRAVVYIVYSMLLQSYYLKKLNQTELSLLRQQQAEKLACEYNVDIIDVCEFFDNENLNEDKFLNKLEVMSSNMDS